MLQVNEIFKNAVEQDSRTFKARVVLGKDIFEGIKSFALHAASNNSDHISIGGAVAASVQVKMEATSISLESKEITLQIGVLSGTEYIYCDLGKFTPEKVNNDDGIINFCAYDRMYVKFSKAYVSKLEYPADGKEVLKEISNMSGVPLASSIDNLPSGVKIPKRWKETETTYDDEGNEITQGNYVNPFDGYTMQDALGYVAQFYGKYCVINRNGEIELRWYEQADYEISASRYYDDLKKSESLFKLGRIQCDTATVTLLSGVGTVGIQIENPVMTQPVLDKICNQLKDFTFQPASVSFLGDPRLDIGDIVTIHDKYGGKSKIPIMKLSMDYDGGLITEIESQGKTEIESGSISSSKGPTAQAIEQAYMTRMTRSSLSEVLRQDYITMARATGLSKLDVIIRHALKNAMLPIVTYLGPLISGLLTGSFVVETMFAIPGIGREFVSAITGRDYPVIMGLTIFIGAFVIVMNLVSDIAAAVVDPRIRLGSK